MNAPRLDLGELVETLKAAHVAIRGNRLLDKAVRADLRLQIARAEKTLAEGKAHG